LIGLNLYLRQLLISLIVIMLACLSWPAEGAQRCAGLPIKLSDVMSYTLWYEAKGDKDLTIQYADRVLQGEFRPRRDVDYWKFAMPLDWAADPYRDDSWQFLLHSLYMLDPLLSAESITGDEKYVRAALRIVADWHHYHIDRGQSAKYSWYNMAVGTRSGKIAYLHDLVCTRYPELMDDANAKIFSELSDRHVASVIDGSIPLRMTNHGLFQVHGLMAMCREFPDVKACGTHRQFVSTNLDKIIRAQFDSEGMHLEHSPGYHGFAVSKLNRLIRTGWYEDLVGISGVAQQAARNLYWLVDPSGRFWGVGDTNSSNIVNVRMSEPSKESCGIPEVTVDASQACVLLRRFSSGYVAIRTVPSVPVSEASGLFFQGAFHSSVHKHLDDQSFELFERGDRVLVDSGYFNYQTHPMRRYMVSTRAHNTVEIGGKDFSRDDLDAYGSAVQEAERVGDYFIVRGRVVHRKLGAVHSRQLLYKPGGWLLVRDWVTGNPGRTVTQWFHMNPKAVLVRQSEHDVTFELSGARYQLSGLSGCHLFVEKGTTEPRLQGWYSPKQGQALPNYAVGFECKEAGSPLQVAITFSSVAAEDLTQRIEALQQRHQFR
jgi:hypothetical protein